MRTRIKVFFARPPSLRGFRTRYGGLALGWGLSYSRGQNSAAWSLIAALLADRWSRLAGAVAT